MNTRKSLQQLRFRLFPFLRAWGVHWPELVRQRRRIRRALGKTTTAAKLSALVQLRHVGPVIATALLHIVAPRSFVPLDRFTLALIAQEQVVANIRSNHFYIANPAAYRALCRAVRRHVRARGESVRAFVRRAR